MKRVKVILSLLALSLIAALPVMAAGGADGSKPAAPAANAAPYEVVWYVIGNGAQPDQDLVAAEINKYLASKNFPGTLKLVPFDWGTYDGKMQQIIASQQAFDICFTASWTNNYRLNATRGAFLDITQLARQYAPKTVAALGDSFMSGSAIGGKNYAIPANKEKAHNWGFLVRTDLVAKYKMDLSKVKTLADIEPFLQVIKQNEPQMYPLEAIVGENPARALDMDNFGDDQLMVGLMNNNKSKTVLFLPETAEAKALYATMRKFYVAGYNRADAAAVTDFNADEKAGLVFAAMKSLKPGKDAEMTISSGQPWTQIEITPPVMTNRETIGSLQAISRTSKRPDLALQFLELFNTDPYLNNLIVYGLEGKHVVTVKPNTIKAGPEQARYNNPQGWMYGNVFINYLFESENPAKWSLFEAYNKNSLPLKSLGFDFDITAIKNEVAAIKNVYAEFMPGIETGSVDPAVELPKAIAKFKAAGIDKVVAEAQKQYDAWLLANNIKY